MDKQVAQHLYDKSFNASLKLHAQFFSVKDNLDQQEYTEVLRAVADFMGKSTAVFAVFTSRYPEIDKVAEYNAKDGGK
jgi:hypothetical protein